MLANNRGQNTRKRRVDCRTYWPQHDYKWQECRSCSFMDSKIDRRIIPTQFERIHARIWRSWWSRYCLLFRRWYMREKLQLPFRDWIIRWALRRSFFEEEKCFSEASSTITKTYFANWWLLIYKNKHQIWIFMIYEKKLFLILAIYYQKCKLKIKNLKKLKLLSHLKFSAIYWSYLWTSNYNFRSWTWARVQLNCLRSWMVVFLLVKCSLEFTGDNDRAVISDSLRSQRVKLATRQTKQCQVRFRYCIIEKGVNAI